MEETIGELTEEESTDLSGALASMVARSAPQHKFKSAEMRRYFLDFQLGLTFPAGIDLGERGSKRRAALTTLSAAWHCTALHFWMVASLPEAGKGTNLENTIKAMSEQEAGSGAH